MRFFLLGIISLSFLYFSLINVFDEHVKLYEQINQESFPFFELPDLMSNNDLSNGDFPNDQLVIVEAFGSWCKNCEKEISAVKNFCKTNNIAFIGLNVMDKKNEAQSFVKNNNIAFENIIFDEKGQLFKDLKLQGAPSFLIVKNGKILHRNEGEIDFIALKKVVSENSKRG